MTLKKREWWNSINWKLSFLCNDDGPHTQCSCIQSLYHM